MAPRNFHELEATSPRYGVRTRATAAAVYGALEGDALDRAGALPWLHGAYYLERGCPSVIVKQAGDMCGATVQYSAPGEREISAGERPLFHAIRFEAAVESSTICGMPKDEIQDWVNEQMGLAASAVLARQVLNAQYDPMNPSLDNQGDDVTTSDVTPLGALAAVEDGLAQKLLNGVGMIHMTPGMLVRLAAGGAVALSGDRWETPTGNVVVADAGYAGWSASTNQQFIYGSAEVRYRWTDVRPVGESWESIDLLHNLFTVRLERYILAMFETCPVVKARADVAASPNLAGGL